MEPFFFLSGKRQLLGVYHSPCPDNERDTGVVICHPLGQEYMRSHRTLTHLARSLAEEGFSVLRFDYSCCGDSEGEADQADLTHWCADITTALDQLKEGTTVTKLYLVGLRLGANLALQASIDHGGVTGIVLWELIADGSAYIDDLQEQHVSWLKGSFCQRRQASKRLLEVLGFPISEQMKSDLLNINVLQTTHECPAHTCLLDSEQAPQKESLTELFEALESTVSFYHLPGNMPWRKQDGISKTLVPKHVIDTITHWIIQTA